MKNFLTVKIPRGFCLTPVLHAPRGGFNLLVLFCLIAASFGAYCNSLQGDFVWDDRALFVEHYDQWQWSNLKQLVTSQDNLFEDRYTGYYRPFPNLTFLVDRYIWGQNPAGYHLTNVIFHALTTLCVYWMALLLFERRPVAFFAALVFAWHPINTESVAWINGRNNVIATCFFVMSVCFYLRFAKHAVFRAGNFVLSLLAFLLSLLSKEYALTLPVFIACHEIVLNKIRMKRRAFRVATIIAPYLFVIIGYIVIRSMVLPAHGIKFMHWDTLWMRVLTVPKTFAIYLRLLVFPIHLTVHYETSLAKTLWDPTFLAGLGIAIVYTWLLVYTCQRARESFVMVFWIFLTLIPVLNIVPLSDDNRFIAERYCYLPCVGFSVLVGQLFAYGWNAWQRRKKIYSGAVIMLSGCLVLQWYLFGTLNRNLAWRNEVNLWTGVVSKAPQWYQPYFNLAVAFRNAGRYDSAINMFEKAYDKAQSRQDKGLVLSNIALVAYRHQKDYDTAWKRLQQAQQLIPEKGWVHNLLGNIHFIKKEYDQALAQYDQALSLDPNDTESLIAKGMTYFKMDRIDETIQYLEEIRAIVPDDGRLDYYLGCAYDRKGLMTKAAAHYDRYLKRLPNDINWHTIAERLKKIGVVPLDAERPRTKE